MTHVLPPSNFKRWRVRIAVLSAVVVAGSAVTVNAIFAATAPPPPDLLSKGKAVTASSIEGGSFAANRAVDGDTGSRWSSAFQDPQWIQVDLGSDATISKVVLNWERAHAKDFTLQTSADGAKWATVATVADSRGGVETVDVSASGRYVKLHATKRSSQYGVSLWEFEVYGKAGAVSGPTTPPAPTGSSSAAQSTTAAPTTTTTTTSSAAPGTTTGSPTVPTQKPIPPNAVRVAEFVAECGFSHRLPDDPIVFPKLAGASHLHTFFGNTSTDAHSDTDSLMAADTKCNPVEDKTAYWTPTVLVDGQPVDPPTSTFYYLGEGVNDEVTKQIQPIPPGLRIIAGNAKATSAEGTRTRWDCNGANVAPSSDFVSCPAGAKLQSYLDFPQCWDGKNLDSADHKSHMAYPVHPGVCPPTHPVPLPKIRQVVNFPISGVDASRIKLSSGPGYTYHMDFMNGWPAAEMERRVRDCINRIVKCGHNGNP
ncbi:DUF1996 domain-containing protein [Umezawaea endophytica]|uniref:DUF1996 domain-containing protein n=1 Tax=Umezawaea endophytica TaxID=1654476 RepID=A0A9X2VPG1_9PSEU|nr:DUF1996 domain-containing protein [Umezawaea endophytica]MCS7479033.1 DUF1996 domain-containing protein [Umezawaea endophytica]